MNSRFLLHLSPLIAVLLVQLGSCAAIRKAPFVDHNLPGKLESTETKPGFYDLNYSLAKKSTFYEFRRYAAHQVSHLCLEKGYKYFVVLESSASLKEVHGAAGGERQESRKATGQVQFLSELPGDKSKAVFDARDLHNNFKAFDSAGDA